MLYYRVNTKDLKGIKKKDYELKSIDRGTWVFISIEHKHSKWKNNESVNAKINHEAIKISPMERSNIKKN